MSLADRTLNTREQALLDAANSAMAWFIGHGNGRVCEAEATYVRERLMSALELYGLKRPKPARQVEVPIADMPIGSQGYTVPWAAWTDNSGTWLNPHYPVQPAPGGTVQLLIERRPEGHFILNPSLIEQGIGWLHRVPAYKA